jgi:hypothetical protein
VRAAVAVIGTLNAQIEALAAQVDAQFGEHPDAAVYRSQPGLGGVLGARVLGEFGDDPGRYRDARARRNYAGSSPVTKQSGKKQVVVARFVRNDRLADPLHQQAFCALTASPGAALTTTSSAPAAPATTPPCASCPTGWSASSTAASRPAPATAKQPRGHTAPPPPPLDMKTAWDV